MDDQNLETKTFTDNAISIPHPSSGIVKKTNFWKWLIPLGVVLILLLLGVLVLYPRWLADKVKKQQISSDASQSATAFKLDSQEGIIPAGFPLDLTFDSNSTILKDNISYSPDGKTATIDRSYQSNVGLQVNYTLINLLKNKGWQTTPIAASSSKQVSFKAVKGNDSATVTITSVDLNHSLVDTVVSFPTP